MSDTYDPNAVYRDSIIPADKLDSKEVLKDIGSMPGVNPLVQTAPKHLSNEEIREMCAESSVPDSKLSHEQRMEIMAYQERMGIGSQKFRNGELKSTRYYSYAK